MSVKSGVKPTAELQTRFAAMRGADCGVQALRVQIVDDQLKETGAIEGAPTKDMSVLAPLADGSAACYFLLRVAASKWRLVQWVPTTLVRVKERMVYASTASAVKDALGNECISDVVNVTTRDELGAVKSPLQRDTSQPEGFRVATGGGALTAREQANLAEKEAQREMAAGAKPGIGGVHKTGGVTLTDGAAEALEKFRCGDVNFVLFSMTDDQKRVDVAQSAVLRDADFVKNVVENEPRFYLYSFGGALRKNVFIYCCPDKSPNKLRMVYSTTKPAILAQITSVGVEVARKLETSDMDEMTHAAIAASANEDRREGNVPTSPVMSSPKTSHVPMAHPVFGHVGSDPSSPSKAEGRSAYAAASIPVGPGGKRIVLPPPVAYQ